MQTVLVTSILHDVVSLHGVWEHLPATILQNGSKLKGSPGFFYAIEV